MKVKKIIPLSVLFLLIVFSLSGCGFIGIKNKTIGNSISKNKLSKVPLGTSQNAVLAEFGEPSKIFKIKSGGKNERIFYYCWEKQGGGKFLFGLINSSGINSKCAVFVFNQKGLLIDKGIGAGINTNTKPAKPAGKNNIAQKLGL